MGLRAQSDWLGECREQMAKARAAASHGGVKPSSTKLGAATEADEEEEDDEDDEEEAGGVGAALGITGYGGGPGAKSTNSQKASRSSHEDAAAGAEGHQACNNSTGSGMQKDGWMDAADVGQDNADSKAEKSAELGTVETREAEANCVTEFTNEKHRSAVPDESARLPPGGSQGEPCKGLEDAEVKEYTSLIGDQEIIQDGAMESEVEKHSILERKESQSMHTKEHVPHESGRQSSSKQGRESEKRIDKKGHRDDRSDRSGRVRDRGAKEQEGRREEHRERERDAARSTRTQHRRHERSRSRSDEHSVSPQRRHVPRRSESPRERNHRGSPRGRRSPHRDRRRSSSREPRRRGQEFSRRNSEDSRRRQRCRSSSRERTRGRDRLEGRSDDPRWSGEKPYSRSRARSRSYSPGVRGARTRTRR